MRTVLVVDDFASIRKVIVDTLKRHGFNTVEASDGKDALDTLKSSETTIDLVLSDYNMPVMNGFQLLQAVKGDDELKHHPVVLLTSEKANDKKMMAKKAGLDAWVEKPYKIDNFINLLNYTIEKSKKNGSV
ncbi:response regulator [Fulvivirga kasyanovii]|uniref:Response regulator n=1 Tax=Fulvivirga kasyanovii TaxID=396812 RepID=A0ABW9RRV2_9BACT|nr:response regulator [Fulvivirga kasyanovii]MTI25710.1 response regulator [Fulvivirga kasyanovii]